MTPRPDKPDAFAPKDASVTPPRTPNVSSAKKPGVSGRAVDPEARDGDTSVSRSPRPTPKRAATGRPSSGRKPVAGKRPQPRTKPEPEPPRSASKPTSAKKPIPLTKPAARKAPGAGAPPVAMKSAAAADPQVIAKKPVPGKAAVSGKAPVPGKAPVAEAALPAPVPARGTPADPTPDPHSDIAPAAEPAARVPAAEKQAANSASTRPANRRRERLMTWVALSPVATLVVILAVSGAVAVPGQGPAGPPSAAAPAAPVAPADVDPALLDAAGWLTDNAARSDRLLVDAEANGVLTAAGWAGGSLVDPSTAGDAFDWRGLAYVAVSPALRATESRLLTEALDNSVPVASFGTGDARVEIRAVAGSGTATAMDAENRRAATRSSFGSELAQNPNIVVSDADRALLSTGMVDDRIIAILGLIASQADVTIAGFPVVTGEEGRPVRQVSLSSVGGRPLVADGDLTSDARSIVSGFLGRFSPLDQFVDDDRLTLRYTLSTSSATD